MKQQIVETDLNKAKTWNESVFLDNDLLMTERISEAPIPTEPRRMNFILIALCTKGKAVYQLDTRQIEITPGDIIIVSERHVVEGYHHSPDLEGLCMLVSVGFFREIIQNVSDASSLFLFSRSHPVMSLEPRYIETFKEYFHFIKQRISDAGNHFRKELIRTLLLAMFYDLSNVVYRARQNDRSQTRAEVIFTRFIRLVETHFKEERRVGWYAQQLCITPKYLSETIKAVSQRTPNEWIDNYVTLEIRVLLRTTTKNIKEIAEELHFPNQSFLGKFFKERVGMSPVQYRRSSASAASYR